MNDFQRETIKRIHENGKIQRQFLSGDRLDKVVEMFRPKKSGTKALIPIGLQALKIKSVTERTANNGKPMGVVEFYKSPEHVWWQSSKQSFKPIMCYHMLQESSDEDPMLWYFQSFTTVMSKEGFEAVKSLRGNIVYAVVMQTHKMLSRYGQVELDALGYPVKYYESSIVDVYDSDCNPEDIQINYWNLYKSL